MSNLLNPDGKTRQCSCKQCLLDEGLKDIRMAAEGNIWWMILCSICGNKRCPHAIDHRNVCTGSNQAGQAGSDY